VALGSKIKLHDVSENCDDDFEIVGSQEANPMQGRISDDSPLGRASSATEGETITWRPRPVLKFKYFPYRTTD
jgi:transcription elongation factor GreA